MAVLGLKHSVAPLRIGLREEIVRRWESWDVDVDVDVGCIDNGVLGDWASL